MFSIEFLAQIRGHELNVIAARLPSGARVLEIGSGTGQQAMMLADLGFDVEAIDVADSNYAADRVFPVRDYDGRHIPFPDGSFDVVFSSNVLEHVPDLGALLRECSRVLRPGGLHVHAMPTTAWRFWTCVSNYVYLVQRLGAAFGVLVPRSTGVGELKRIYQWAYLVGGLIWTYAVPPRHGETGLSLTELWTFHPLVWRRRLGRAGLRIMADYPMGLFYTGHMILGNCMSLPAREKAARLLGSSCHLYVCTLAVEGLGVARGGE